MRIKKIKFEFSEYDIVYLLNCICLTKDILKTGRRELYERYFKKEKFNTYIWDITILQKLMGYKANRVFYNFNDYDLFIGQIDYINIGDREFDYLFGKQRKDRLKELKQEIKYREKITKFNSIEKDSRTKYFQKNWFFRKNA